MDAANMDVDVAWCLTCSKRTRDARSTYCSDACRLADTNPPLGTTSVPLTSPLPGILSPTTRSTPRLKSTSPVKPARAGVTMVPLSPEAEITPLELAPAKVPRDRAFSFPAQASSSKRPRPSNNVLPPFARKSSIVANMTSPILGITPLPEQSRKSKKIGATLPDSVFLSTSESSDEELPPRPKSVAAEVGIQLPVAMAKTPSVAQTLPDNQFSTLRSQLSSRSHLRTREAHSPVAAMVASSASSRSREDIISWAKAVGSRPDESDDDDRRGRSRTRRKETLANLPPPSTEPLDEEVEVQGTTPKGRIGALALGMTGFVKALTGVASPAKPSSSVLGLQSVPAPAEVSRIAVVASTLPDENQYPIGATPTLSTISFSEVPDPSVMGTHDHVDVVTDDQSMASDYIRRSSVASAYRKSSVAAPGKPEPRQISTTIWSLSSYLRSLAPFSISSVIAPYAPFAASPHPTAVSSTPSLVKSPMPPPAMPAPAPIRADANTAEFDLVRSLPMDIMMPLGLETQPRNTPSPRSRRSRSGSRSRQRDRSRSRRGSNENENGAQWSSDGAEGDVDSDDRRGRSRKGKVIGSTDTPPLAPEARVRGSKSRTESRGRGRDRAVRA